MPWKLSCQGTTICDKFRFYCSKTRTWLLCIRCSGGGARACWGSYTRSTICKALKLPAMLQVAIWPWLSDQKWFGMHVSSLVLRWTHDLLFVWPFDGCMMPLHAHCSNCCWIYCYSRFTVYSGSAAWQNKSRTGWCIMLSRCFSVVSAVPLDTKFWLCSSKYQLVTVMEVNTLQCVHGPTWSHHFALVVHQLNCIMNCCSKSIVAL